jgi:hypothetical protein
MTMSTLNDLVADDEPALTDDELAAVALAADPDLPLADDAVPLADPDAPSAFLPSWYMPVARARRGTAWRRVVIAVIVLAFLLINVLGLCITYGRLEVA